MSTRLIEGATTPIDGFIPDAAIANEPIEGIQRYGFRIGPFGFIFPENCSGEIVTAPEICPIPHTRHWMLGVMTLRGNLIPVFDLYELLLETPTDLNKPMVLILDQGKQALGFVLQESPLWLSELIEVPTADLPLPELIATQIDKLYQHQESYWWTFNKTDLFTFLANSAKSC